MPVCEGAPVKGRPYFIFARDHLVLQDAATIVQTYDAKAEVSIFTKLDALQEALKARPVSPAVLLIGLESQPGLYGFDDLVTACHGGLMIVGWDDTALPPMLCPQLRINLPFSEAALLDMLRREGAMVSRKEKGARP